MDGYDSAMICGICLFDDENAMRGQIDSCDHFFCFVCIMEWAKVQSRCPMCKRRFTTIRRPPKPPVFPSERLVRVPERDQVYHVDLNTTVQHFDPYAQVECSLCHTSEDDCFLLLCDLCDSASHTYCVGLGTTVPEGDWFCHDCAVSRNEHESMQKDVDDDGETLNVKREERVAAGTPNLTSDIDVSSRISLDCCDAGEVNEANVSIFDVVRGPDDRGRLKTRVSPVSSSRKRQTSLTDYMSDMSSERKALQSDARTLRRRLDVQIYVQALRENWDALQTGSLKFSSGSSSAEGCNTHLAPLSSNRSQHLTTEDGLQGTSAQGKHSHDVKRAWKMMAKAKSVKQNYRRTISAQNVSNVALRNASTEATGGSYGLHSLRSQQIGSSESKRHYKFHCFEKHTEKHISANLKMESNNTILANQITGYSDKLQSTLPGSSASTSCPRKQISCQNNVCHGSKKQVPKINRYGGSLDATDQQNACCHSKPSVGSTSAPSASMNSKDFSPSFNSKLEISQGDVSLEKGSTESRARKEDDAKSEIQALVKLNLKLLNGNKRLGVDAFKEVARLATHTILAACGFKHSRHVLQSSLRSVCSHTEHEEQLCKSTLMSNSCRQCFCVFVKDVVHLALSEKLCQPSS